jgi:hypothetical protein
MIGSLAHAGQALSEPRYTEAAIRAADFVLENLWVDGRLLRRWRDGEARFQGYLDDYVFTVYGLLELHETTGDHKWLEWATRLMDAAIAEFWDQSDGGFFYSGASSEELLVRRKDALDHPLPSGNGTAALVLLRLADLTGDESYAERAERTLVSLMPWMERAPHGTDTLALATATYFDRLERRRQATATGPPVDEPRPVTGESHPVRLTATLPKTEVRPGEEFAVRLMIQIADGWHINSNEPRQDFLVPTSLASAGSIPVTAGRIAYPAGRELELAGDTLLVYEGKVDLTVPITVAADAAPGPGSVVLRLRFQACDSASCLPPDRVEVELPLTVAGER